MVVLLLVVGNRANVCGIFRIFATVNTRFFSATTAGITQFFTPKFTAALALGN
jgi:hypothetical protein